MFCWKTRRLFDSNKHVNSSRLLGLLFLKWPMISRCRKKISADCFSAQLIPAVEEMAAKDIESPIFRAICSPDYAVKRELPGNSLRKTLSSAEPTKCALCTAELVVTRAAGSSTGSYSYPTSPPPNMPAYNCELDSAAQIAAEGASPQPLPLPRQLDQRSFEQQLVNDIDTFIFDADGVLWLGEQSIPGSSDFVDRLASLGKRIIVLTNNATKSRAVYAKKLANLGYGRCINEHNIVNPAAVVADYLHRSGLGQQQDKKVYLIGGQGVKDEMALLGIDYFGDGFDPVDSQPASKGSAFLYELELEEDPGNVGAVVVGYEKYFNYLKLMKAANYLRNEDCLFLATNEDETCPGPNPDTVIPDAGPLVAAVKTAAAREPLVVGKPNTPAFDYICRRWKINPKRTLMVGDRLNTDVKFGRDHGLRTMLVLSGCHSVEDIVESQLQGRLDQVPDFYAKCLGALVPLEEKMDKKCQSADGAVVRKALCAQNC